LQVEWQNYTNSANKLKEEVSKKQRLLSKQIHEHHVESEDSKILVNAGLERVRLTILYGYGLNYTADSLMLLQIGEVVTRF
jgi:hypothetical protein